MIKCYECKNIITHVGADLSYTRQLCISCKSKDRISKEQREVAKYYEDKFSLFNGLKNSFKKYLGEYSMYEPIMADELNSFLLLKVPNCFSDSSGYLPEYPDAIIAICYYYPENKYGSTKTSNWSDISTFLLKIQQLIEPKYNPIEYRLYLDFELREILYKMFRFINFDLKLPLSIYHFKRNQKGEIEENQQNIITELFEANRLKGSKSKSFGRISRNSKYDSKNHGHHDSAFGWDKSNKWNVD